jgi:protein involved in polysaccharide export with SLBB domain
MKSTFATVLWLAFLVTCLWPTTNLAQVRDGNDRNRESDRSTSRAEREAERLVSLSADRIIVILNQEPGLLLEVKKMLVRTAFEQGRVVEAKDLEDDEVFRLIRQEPAIRALITREIEDRSYVRAKPTQQQRAEMDRRGYESQMNSTQLAGASRMGGQEDAYWMRREMAPGTIAPPLINPPAPAPGMPPSQSNPAGTDSSRIPNRAQTTSPSVDYVDIVPGTAGQVPPIPPDQMPALLNASASGAGLPGTAAGKNDSGLAALMGPAGTGTPIFDVPKDNGTPPWPDSPAPTRAQSTGFQSRLDHPVLHRRPNPYADVPSLYDLYSQYSNRPPTLERFGAEIFRSGTGNSEQLPMDLPVGPDYIVGPGDGLSVDLWGSVSQRLQRVVDRQGRMALPEVGAIEVSGRTLGEVQHLVQRVLRTQFRDIQADVSLSRVRTVRVYVVGDVQRPGAYDVSSLSTPLNAVYTAGGPTQRGSLRILRHMRGGSLVQELDVYDLLLRGVRSRVERLQPGDTVLVPPLGPEVTIEGMVRRPAIYELHGEKSLSEVLELSGGVLPTGTLREVDVDRLEAHDHRAMLRVDLPEKSASDAATAQLDDFQVQDGDRIKILPILPYTEKTVYLDGHAFRPGKYAYRDGMKITDVVASYRDLLPEPSQHAEIVRLAPPDFKPMIIAFNLNDALAGHEQDTVLKPFDTIRVFGRYDFENPPLITITGEVRHPGDHLSNGVTHVTDAVYLAGGTTPDAELDDAQVFRKTTDGKLRVISVNLAKAMSGDANSNIALEAEDRVFIHKSLARSDPSTVTIQGEVGRPGKYPLGDGMTAAELVRLAGGMKRSAYLEAADLTRYDVEEGSKVASEHFTVAIGHAMAGDPDTDFRLHDGDVLTIRELGGWNNVGATVTIKGEVLHGGTFGIQDGERLSSVIARAGGFSGDAYPYATVFTRVQVRSLEEKNRADLLRRLQDEGAQLKMVPEGDLESKLAKEAALLQWHTTVEKLQTTPPEGRMVVHISSNIKRWENTSLDVPVRAGDIIYIPKRPNFITVDGAVYNPTAISFKPGKSASWYLQQSGGPTSTANKKAIFVIRADGSVVGGKGGMFTGGALEAQLQPGDMVIVPEKAFAGPTTWRNALQVAQLVSAVGIAVQVARGF